LQKVSKYQTKEKVKGTKKSISYPHTTQNAYPQLQSNRPTHNTPVILMQTPFCQNIRSCETMPKLTDNSRKDWFILHQ